MASTTPSVSFPVRWSSFITIETREPRLILARSVPAILGNLPFLLLRCGPERRIMQADLTRGYAYYDLGQYQLAIQDFNEAIRLHPQDALAYYGRGVAYEYLGNYSEAERDFQKAKELGFNP